MIDHGGVRATSSAPGVPRHRAEAFFQFLRLEGNALVQPLVPAEYPVGADLADIPKVLSRLKGDFEDIAASVNMTTTWNFSRLLRQRSCYTRRRTRASTS